MRSLLILIMAAALAACGSQSGDPGSEESAFDPSGVSLEARAETGRWYSKAQVSEGRELYGRFCIACHGAEAKATADWKTPNADGTYPPPPLNGSAHAWHHPLSVLDQVIREGTASIGGAMPAWGEMLNAQERLAVIAGFQEYWPEDVYNTWLVRERSSR